MKTKKIDKIKKIAIIIFSVILIGAIIKSAALLSSFNSLNNEYENKIFELNEIQEKNEGYKALLKPENESTFMEEYAHKMGYAYSDEKLYFLE